MTGPAPVSVRSPASPLPDDLAASLAALQARAYAAIGLRAWSAAELAALAAMPTGRLWIAEGGDRAVRGFLLGSFVAGEGEILALAVDPAHRRRKTAHRLLETMIAEARLETVERLILEVASTNGAAIGVYRMLNFHDIGTRPNYYRIGTGRIDARLMEKRLI